jgi:hypothetical protein
MDSATNPALTSVHVAFLRKFVITTLDQQTFVHYTVYTKSHNNFHSDVLRRLLIIFRKFSPLCRYVEKKIAVD